LQVARGGGVVVAPDGGGEGGQGQHQHQQHHAHAVDEPAAADAPDLPLVRDLHFFGHVSTSSFKRIVCSQCCAVYGSRLSCPTYTRNPTRCSHTSASWGCAPEAKLLGTPSVLKCSGEINSPCAKVLALLAKTLV